MSGPRRDGGWPSGRSRGGPIVDQARIEATAKALGVPIRLRISPRARRTALRIDAAERAVELVLPEGEAVSRGLAFAAEHRHWIAARLAALPQRVAFAEGSLVPLLGVDHRIVIEADSAAAPVMIVNHEIRVRGDPAHLARRVHDHLRLLARIELARRARRLAGKVGHKIAEIGVRDTKSRWGSCSSTGSLSFSWRLILAPERVVDYVVAHEVAHLVEMNHSRRFWQLVEQLSPGAAEPRAWLKRHRGRLLAYG